MASKHAFIKETVSEYVFFSVTFLTSVLASFKVTPNPLRPCATSISISVYVCVCFFGWGFLIGFMGLAGLEDTTMSATRTGVCFLAFGCGKNREAIIVNKVTQKDITKGIQKHITPTTAPNIIHMIGKKMTKSTGSPIIKTITLKSFIVASYSLSFL